VPFLHLAWGYFTAISRIVAFDNLFHANGEDYFDEQNPNHVPGCVVFRFEPDGLRSSW